MNAAGMRGGRGGMMGGRGGGGGAGRGDGSVGGGGGAEKSIYPIEGLSPYQAK